MQTIRTHKHGQATAACETTQIDSAIVENARNIGLMMCKNKKENHHMQLRSHGREINGTKSESLT
jgi:hypothetical protein